jgi:transposase
MTKISYKGYRFPPEIILQAIWLYLRITLSFRDVEDLLAERGIMVSYETVRRWVNHFLMWGLASTTSRRCITRRRPSRSEAEGVELARRAPRRAGRSRTFSFAPHIALLIKDVTMITKTESTAATLARPWCPRHGNYRICE